MYHKTAPIRTMVPGDVPAAASVGTEVGWPGREARFGFYIRHPFCEALVVEVDGEAAGVGFGIRNGSVGWIGMICVRPRHQGRGIGRELTIGISERLEDRGCRTLVLTATEAGRPTYEKMGFSTETFYRGFAGPGLDRRMTGEDRSHLLRELAGPGWVIDGEGEVRGYHLSAPWGDGPTVASNPGVARALVRTVRTLAGAGETARFWLASENGDGMEHMREIGFEETRRLPRMTRGEALSWRPEALWGLFSLGKG